MVFRVHPGGQPPDDLGSAEKLLSGLVKCPAANDQAADVQPACHVFRSIEAITVAVVQVWNTVKMWRIKLASLSSGLTNQIMKHKQKQMGVLVELLTSTLNNKEEQVRIK